jgi:hypothetical protein
MSERPENSPVNNTATWNGTRRKPSNSMSVIGAKQIATSIRRTAFSERVIAA